MRFKIEQNPPAKLHNVFRDEDGAIDLASIMVGVLVIGLIGGVIAATIFAVIPWAQDAAAKHQLESIHTAENAYYGFTSASLSSLPVGTKPNSFASSSDLAAASLLIQTPDRYCAVVSPDGKNYDAYSLSATGKLWASNDKQVAPYVFNGTLPTACPELVAAYNAAVVAAGGTASGTTAGGPGDISSPGMGDGTTAATTGTITGDGSGSYFPKDSSWLGAYGPVMTNTLNSPILDLKAWSYDSVNRRVHISFKTDGSFSGIGGSWIYLMNVDVSCYDTASKTYTHYTTAGAGTLAGPYASGNPGPNSSGIAVDCGSSAPPTAVPSQVLVRQATMDEWNNYSLGHLWYVYTMPGLSEGWVNSAVPQE